MKRRSLDVSCSPRLWLSRRPGECAFPVDGDGWTVRSCCNPCIGAYCAAHRQALTAAGGMTTDKLEAHLRALGI